MLCTKGRLSFLTLCILWAISAGAHSAGNKTAALPSPQPVVTDASSSNSPLEASSKTYALSMHGDVKYKEGAIFNAVNPEAPKGGALRFGVVGTFDSTNPFIDRGTPPAGLSLFSEHLVSIRIF